MNWTPWALPGAAVLVGGLALAWFVYRARPDRHANRVLALQVLLEAVAVGIIGGAYWLLDAPVVMRILVLVAMGLVWPKLWSYYSFLATLDTPLARSLRSRGVLPALLALTLVLGLSVGFTRDWYVGPVDYWPSVDSLHVLPGFHFIAILWIWATMWISGLAFSISALRQARTEIRREQAKAYLVAFGWRDTAFVLCVLAFTVVPPTDPRFHWLFVAFPTTLLVYYPLVGWGILRHQLLDIELKLKKGIQRSVVAAMIAGAFFLLSYAFEQFVAANDFVFGLVVAAGITVAFRPIQSAAERLADRVLPSVDDSEDYRAARGLEIYREAVEAALLDGTITERERAILGTLRNSLELPESDAARVEVEAAQALA